MSIQPSQKLGQVRQPNAPLKNPDRSAHITVVSIPNGWALYLQDCWASFRFISPHYPPPTISHSFHSAPKTRSSHGHSHHSTAAVMIKSQTNGGASPGSPGVGGNCPGSWWPSMENSVELCRDKAFSIVSSLRLVVSDGGNRKCAGMTNKL